MEWLVWAVLLIAQNASFTAVSRARNSNSLWYNGVASTISNGVWLVNQFIAVNKFLDVKKSGNLWELAAVVVFYTFFTATASVGMQAILIRFKK